MIHYIQPYRSDKSIGLAINNAIKQLNASNEDWICLLDHDVLWLLPDSKAQLEEVLYETKFDILGPLTNRLGSNTQLVRDAFDKTDIMYHLNLATDLSAAYWGETLPTNETLAAFCLCFRVSTWKSLGGFQENSLQFDWMFSEMAKKMGFKLGIMTGIYMLHLYRMGRSKDDYSHLI